jgi:hypothetical protein
MNLLIKTNHKELDFHNYKKILLKYIFYHLIQTNNTLYY